ncbi:MAG: dipeptidase [Myxococcota bacterium]
MSEAETTPDTAFEGVSDEAWALTQASDVIDLHIDTLIPKRLWGRDPLAEHGWSPLAGRFFGHLDLPRLEAGSVTGAMWSITTNPFRTAQSRWRTFLKNLEFYGDMAQRSDGRIRVVTTYSDYVEARRAGAHACLPAIQGGNALEAAPDLAGSIPNNMMTRITLVHLTNSGFGTTSSPGAFFRAGEGLTSRGKDLVVSMNAHRVLVDLAHINPKGFWDAVEVHDGSAPLIVTHTGVDGVCPHWRNLDDAQLAAIADSGGTIGVMFHQGFLKRRGGPRGIDMVIEHLAHIVDTVGEDHASIGTDYDGAITPPAGCRDGLAYPRLTEAMLQLGWSDTRIQKILGLNALRVLRAIRP